MPASYAHGTSLVPLIGETIGASLRRTMLQFPDREALVVRSQGYRATSVTASPTARCGTRSRTSRAASWR
jgi:hypothetical protein